PRLGLLSFDLLMPIPPIAGSSSGSSPSRTSRSSAKVGVYEDSPDRPRPYQRVCDSEGNEGVASAMAMTTERVTALGGTAFGSSIRPAGVATSALSPQLRGARDHRDR